MTRKYPWQFWLALAIWVLVFLGLISDVVRKPLKHTTVPTYDQAATLWWAGQDPYSEDLHAGFFYFPQAAIIYTPFSWGPPLSNYFRTSNQSDANRLHTVPKVGELFWRLLVFALYAYALMRLGRVFLGGDRPFTAQTFLLLSFLAVPASLASLRNAQYDLPLAALVVLVAAEIAQARWNAATLWLCLAVALKPLAVVPLLLFGALYWKLVPRLIIGLLIIIAIPFLNWNPTFVAHEYARCGESLFLAGTQVNEPRYSDMVALVSHIGIYPPDWLKTLVRVSFAAIYLGLGFAATRRLSLINSAWVVGALSTDYLMLFNPRTETCSYVFLGPFIATLALLYTRQSGRKWVGYLLGFAALGLACDAIPGLHDLTDRWFKPFLALLFLPVVVQFIFDWKNFSPQRTLSLGKESPHQPISLTYSIADQSFIRTKSLGILNVSVDLLQVLARRKEFSRVTVLANSSLTDFLAPQPGMTVEFHDHAGNSSLGRMYWDQIGLYSAAQRAGNEWLFLPKGFASFTRSCPARLAVLVHDLMQQHYDLTYPGTVPALEAAYFRAGFRASLQQAEIVFTPTEFTRQEILRTAQAKGWNIPNVVCCGEGFDPLPSSPATERRDIVVLASRFPHKLTRVAVDFLDRWQQKNRFAEKIHWIGSLPKNLTLPAHSNWQMGGRLPEPEFRDVMSRARAVLFFSDYEGFGRPPVEAVLAGAAPVYSSIPATREVMGDDGCPFDNASYESFAAALDQALLIRPEQLQAWAGKLLARHDWNKVVDCIITALLEKDISPRAP